VIWVAIAIAGGLGATSRYLVDLLISRRTSGRFPWGTFVINLSGSFAAGLVAGLAVTSLVPTEVRTVVAGGFLGAYTTFSTAMYETVQLLDEGSRGVAIGNVLAPLVASVVAAMAGWWIVT
jgi:fluoride exporter